MPQFTAGGEFGEETVEADNQHDAAKKTAKAHAGLDGDDICRDPFWFTIAPLEAPNNTREFQAEWNPQDGLLVFDVASGELL